jgi:hypothetical protein
MRINFFEEFPTEENLKKAEIINFPSTIFIAAHSLLEFYKFKEKLATVNSKLEAAYWPIIPNTYWISPFSYTKDLENLVNEFNDIKEPLIVLIDLELPVIKKSGLYFRNLIHIHNNKKIIKNLFKNSANLNIKIVTAEYPVVNSLFLNFFKKMGVWYDTNKYPHSSCVMYYTSMIPSKFLKMTKRAILRTKKEINPNLELGLGVIAQGILGNEPILSPEKFNEDLIFMKENGFNIATIFRLGGLDDQYYKIIEQYADK